MFIGILDYFYNLCIKNYTITYNFNTIKTKYGNFVINITTKRQVKIMYVRNRLAVLMAERGIRSVSELQRLIQDRGLTISRRTLDKFYNNESNRFDMDTLATLCVILDCQIGDILELIKENDISN